MLLNRRLKLLKADEQSLRATISELVTATQIAERAIGGLKLTVHECDMGLGERLRKAERMTVEIDRTITAGKELLSRLSQIVTAGRSAAPPIEPRRRAEGRRRRRQSRRRGGGSLRREAAHEGARSRGMIRYVRDLRLIPIALIASACLLALKIADLALHGSGFFASDNTPASEVPRRSFTRCRTPRRRRDRRSRGRGRCSTSPTAAASQPMPSASPNILPKIADRDAAT